MSKNAMAGAVALVGTGLCMIGGAMLLQQTPQANATASVPSFASTAIVAAAAAQTTPTVVWMGVTAPSGGLTVFHRIWSDGRQECRTINVSWVSGVCGPGSSSFNVTPSCTLHDWIEIPPPPSGNGLACRTDINGDRRIDGADLGLMLGDWGSSGSCEPQPTYPCLDLSLAGGGALR
jgi:hypothetical protein